MKKPAKKLGRPKRIKSIMTERQVDAFVAQADRRGAELAADSKIESKAARLMLGQLAAFTFEYQRQLVRLQMRGELTSDQSKTIPGLAGTVRRALVDLGLAGNAPKPEALGFEEEDTSSKPEKRKQPKKKPTPQDEDLDVEEDQYADLLT